MFPMPRFDGLAGAVLGYLSSQECDLAAVAELKTELGVWERPLLAAVGHHPYLSVGGRSGSRFVWSTQRAVEAGFVEETSAGQRMLQLSGANPGLGPLVVSGEQVGADPPLGLDELGNAVVTLSTMAGRWLRQPSLFGLLAQAWRRSSGPGWRCGRLQVHRVELDEPVGVRPWAGEAESNVLELVVWEDAQRRQQLVNVYPGGPGRALGGARRSAAALASVVAVRDEASGILGSAVAVADGLAVTALHVVRGRRARSLRVDGLAVSTVVTVPAAAFGADVGLAQRSRRRSRELTGADPGSVDLALLVVPGLAAPAARLREGGVVAGEPVTVGGYPQHRWAVSLGPVSAEDGADFVAHLAVGGGASGGGAFDTGGRLTGIVTMSDLAHGAVLVGPRLLATFLDRAVPLARFAGEPPDPGW